MTADAFDCRMRDHEARPALTCSNHTQIHTHSVCAGCGDFLGVSLVPFDWLIEADECIFNFTVPLTVTLQSS